jgi:hypothetical protein
MIVPLGANGDVELRNPTDGTVTITVDVFGYFLGNS